MAQRIHRETATNFDHTKWSTWKKMMVATTDGAGPDFEARPGALPGYRLPPQKVREKLGRDGQKCGIYEWRARRNERGAKGIVVYVGSTSRVTRGSLSTRIIEYCSDGSHKKIQINHVLNHNYELWVRVKTCVKKETAEKRENELLEKYDYAWNETDNSDMRDIL